jgi:uncharacterized RDD family membrane protein YckC
MPVVHPPAGVWRRFMCAGYEGLVLFAVAVFFGYAFSAITRFEGHLPESAGLRVAFQCYLLMVIGGYFTWFWSRGRRTLPMKTLGIRLVDAQGQPLTPARALSRYLAALLCLGVPVALGITLGKAGFALILLPFFWALIHPTRSSLYDLIAGTRLVIDDPARPAPGQAGKVKDTQSTK